MLDCVAILAYNPGFLMDLGLSPGSLLLTVNYYHTDIVGFGLNVTNYGAGGEYYFGPEFTVAVKGGGNNVEVDHLGHDNGGYVGGQLQWYIMPNLSLSGAVDYADIKLFNTTSETVKGEWLVSESMPVSVYGGYQHVEAALSGLARGGHDVGP